MITKEQIENCKDLGPTNKKNVLSFAADLEAFNKKKRVDSGSFKSSYFDICNKLFDVAYWLTKVQGAKGTSIFDNSDYDEEFLEIDDSYIEYLRANGLNKCATFGEYFIDCEPGYGSEELTFDEVATNFADKDRDVTRDFNEATKEILNLMAKTSSKESSTVKEKIVSTAKAVGAKVKIEAVDASTRTLSHQFYLTVKEPMGKILSTYIDVLPSPELKMMATFALSSPMGDAIMKYVLGTALPQFSGLGDNAMIAAMSQELCTQGVQHFTDKAAEAFFVPLRQTILQGLQTSGALQMLGNTVIPQLSAVNTIDSNVEDIKSKVKVK